MYCTYCYILGLTCIEEEEEEEGGAKDVEGPDVINGSLSSKSAIS